MTPPSLTIPNSSQVTGSEGDKFCFTPSFDGNKEISGDGDMMPAAWLANSEKHKDFWQKVEPMVREMQRLRRKYGVQQMCHGRMELACPPHVECLLKNWEKFLVRAHRKFTRNAESSKGAVTSYTCEAPPAFPAGCQEYFPQIHEYQEHQKKAA